MRFSMRKHVLPLLLIMFTFASNALLVKPVLAESHQQTNSNTGGSKRFLILPYPFFNETIGYGAGAAFVSEGYIQRRTLTVGSFLASNEGTWYGFFMIRNYQTPIVKRLFLEPEIAFGKFNKIQAYITGNPNFATQVPGKNDSDKDNFIEAEGTDNFIKFRMKYLLPLGHGKFNIHPQTKINNGIYESGEAGGKHWSPLKSGRTFINFEPFYRKQKLEDENDTVQRTFGTRLGLSYDNTDFRLNPSRGSFQKIYFMRDWGGPNSSAPWSVAGLDITKYISLGRTENARQRVIVLNFWTEDTLTWNSFDTASDGTRKYHRPPTYKGPNLGGLWRLRGYQSSRFHDRSAIYYAMEYRHTLRWNPLVNITFNNRLDVDWVQLVGFGELGRVAPSWNAGTLHEDMKWSVGGGLRVMANNIVIRLDFAKSYEEILAQLFIGHPF